MSIPSDGDCFCANPAVLGLDAGIFDGVAQGAAVYSQGCKGGSSLDAYFTFANPDCQLGFINGFAMGGSPAGGWGNRNGDDGDIPIEVCPFLGAGALASTGDPWNMELRSDRSFFEHGGAVKLEWLWCRHFFGQLQAHVTRPDGGEKDVCFSEAAPRAGDRVSAAGDWVLDHKPPEGWTELHEARIISAIRRDPDCDLSQECSREHSMADCPSEFCDAATRPVMCDPNEWHLLTSGFFAPGTWQGERLTLNVPMPPPRDANGNPRPVVPGQDVIDCGKGKGEAADALPGPGPSAAQNGCQRPGVSAKATPNDTSGSILVSISRNGAPASTRPCSKSFLCPDLGVPGGGVDYSGYDRCNASADSKVGFAGDFLCRWKDPVDVWMCDGCRCGDPAAAGSFFSASAQGYVSGLDPASPASAAAACNAVCGGFVCGGAAPSCEMSACAPPPESEARAHLVAPFGGEPPPPLMRVSDVSNYTVALVPGLGTGSFLEVSSLDAADASVPAGSTTVEGTLHVNLVNVGAEQQLEFSDFSIRAAPFSAFSTDFTEVYAFVTYRFLARFTTATDFRVPRGQFNAGVRATIAGSPGGTNVRNEDDLTGTFDASAGTFTLHGEGRNDEGKVLAFTLVGRIVNNPPVVSAGPDRSVECESSALTQVGLSATAVDPDPGDAVTRFQWFEGNRGMGTQQAPTAQATYGRHLYTVHGYDSSLASALSTVAVEVVDTTPPSLTVSPEALCLWPPNHDFARFVLGRELVVQTSDTCSSTAPQVRIESVLSDETVGAAGSGSTSPDVVFGPTTACVRSERTGGGAGRHYTLTLVATDEHRNQTRRVVRIVVPHDRSANPKCTRAEGLATPDPSCSL